MFSLEAAIKTARKQPYAYPANDVEFRAGIAKTVGWTAAGCFGLMGTLSICSKVNPIRFTLVAGTAWTLPMAAMSASLYSVMATPIERKAEVLEAATEHVGHLQEDEVVAKCLGYAERFDAVAALHDRVISTSARDEVSTFVERQKKAIGFGAAVGMGIGVALWSFLLATEVGEGTLNASSARHITLAAAGMGTCFGLLIPASELSGHQSIALRDMPGTQHLVKVARNRGDVEQGLTTFYAEERSGGDLVKKKVHELLGVSIA